MILPHTRRLSRVSCKKWVRSQHFSHKNFLRWILIHSHKLFRKEHITSAETLYYQNIRIIYQFYILPLSCRETKSLHDTFFQILQTPLCDSSVAKSTMYMQDSSCIYFSSYKCSSCSRSCISCLSWTKNIVIHILKVQIRPLVSCLCAYHWTLCLAVSSFSHWNLAIYIQEESSQRGHLSSVQGTRNTRYFIIQCYFWLNILYIYFYLKSNNMSVFKGIKIGVYPLKYPLKISIKFSRVNK
jgi:hypothetical protein